GTDFRRTLDTNTGAAGVCRVTGAALLSEQPATRRIKIRTRTMRSPYKHDLLRYKRKPERTGKSCRAILQHDANSIIRAVCGDGVLQHHPTQEGRPENLFSDIEGDRPKWNVFLF